MYEKLLTESQQDYLKIINSLVEKNKVARVKEIAREKGVSMPSVTESVKKLAGENWISYKSRGFIELTEKGEKAANYFAKRTEFLKNFLHDVLGSDEQKADAEACTLEHHLSDDSLKNLGLLYQFLNHCPKMETNLLGLFKKCVESSPSNKDYFCIMDNYPHFVSDEKHILLKNLPAGKSAKIMLISPDNDIRSFFLDIGLLPGLEISMLEKTEKSITIKYKNQKIEIPGNFGDKVEVSITNQEKDNEN